MYTAITVCKWTFCNMTETAIIIATGSFISTCAGVGGEWRRIATSISKQEVTAPLDGIRTLTQMLVSTAL